MTRIKRAQKPKEPIPTFESVEEEAAFWETHDLADYWDEFEPVEVRFAKKLSDGVTIRLAPDEIAALRAQAREKGIGPGALARLWILERLREHALRSTTTNMPDYERPS